MPHAFHPTAQLAELLGDDSLTLEELARACRRAPDWVSERVSAGVIEPQASAATRDPVMHWRFASAMLVRAQRVSDLEACFDADPNLAALTVDLIEEVNELRLQVQRLRQARSAGSPL